MIDADAALPSPNPTQRGYEEALMSLNARFPLMVARHIPRLAAEMLRADAGGASLKDKANALKTAGEPLTVDEKKAYGLPIRMTFGRSFVAVVTPLALINPVEACRAIAIAGSKAEERRLQFALCVHDGCEARLMIRDDAGTCEAARFYMAAVMPPATVPSFPLKDCDKWTCRCSLNRYADWMGGKEFPPLDVE